jgi:hypothetical protein
VVSTTFAAPAIRSTSCNGSDATTDRWWRNRVTRASSLERPSMLWPTMCVTWAGGCARAYGDGQDRSETERELLEARSGSVIAAASNKLAL